MKAAQTVPQGRQQARSCKEFARNSCAVVLCLCCCSTLLGDVCAFCLTAVELVDSLRLGFPPGWQGVEAAHQGRVGLLFRLTIPEGPGNPQALVLEPVALSR